jgi:uncharacterized protein (DUF58 family)
VTDRKHIWGTRRAGLLFISGVALYGVGRLTSSSWLVFVVAAGAACLVVDFVVLASGGQLSVQFRRPTRVAVGSDAAVLLSVRNVRSRSLAAVEVYDDHPGFARGTGLILDVPGKRVGAAVLNVPATRRGCYQRCGEFGAVVSGPLGLFELRMRGVVTGPLFVHPPPAEPLTMPVTEHAAGVRATSRRGRGIELHGLRPWRPGDPGRSIHWRSTARVGRPVVMERASEVSTGLVVIVGPATAGPVWEHRVAIAAATAVDALQHGVAPVLLASIGLPPPERPTRDDVLDWFAALPCSNEFTPDLAGRAAAAAGEGGTLVWLATVDPLGSLVAAVSRTRGVLLPIGEGAGHVR